MIRLTYSNRTEALVDALVERLEARRASGISPLVPVHLVVPNRNLERFLELAIAEATGIAANLRFHRLERFVARWVQRELPGARPLGRRGYESLVLAALLDEAWLAEPEVTPQAEIEELKWLPVEGPITVERAALTRKHLFPIAAARFAEARSAS